MKLTTGLITALLLTAANASTAAETALTCKGAIYEQIGGFMAGNEVRKIGDLDAVFLLDVDAGYIKTRNSKTGLYELHQLTGIEDTKIFWDDEDGSKATLDRITLNLEAFLPVKKVLLGAYQTFFKSACAVGRPQI